MDFLGANSFSSFYKTLLYEFSFIERTVCVRLGAGKQSFSFCKLGSFNHVIFRLHLNMSYKIKVKISPS